MISTLSIFVLVLGIYVFIHNELLLHNTKLTKNYSVIGWRCFFGGLLIAAGLAGILS